MKKLDNKGLSLVELVIAVGIFALVMVAMMRVLTISSRTYTKGNEEVSVQNEATALMNHLENDISQAKYGAYTEDNASGDTIYLYIFYDDSFATIWYDKDNREIYLAEVTAAMDSSLKGAFADYHENSASMITDMAAKAKTTFNTLIGTNITNKAQYLLAEDVESFGVVTNNDYGYVSIYLTIKKNMSTTKFTASKNINIRNISKGLSTSGSTGGSFVAGDVEDENVPTGGGTTEGEGTTTGGGTTGGEGTPTGGGTTGGTVTGGTTVKDDEKYVTYNVTVKCDKVSASDKHFDLYLGNWTYQNHIKLEPGDNVEFSFTIKVLKSDYDNLSDKNLKINGPWNVTNMTMTSSVSEE